MRILYVLGFLPTYVKREIEALAGEGNEILVLLPADNSNTSDLWKRITNDPESGGAATLRVMPFSLFLLPAGKLLGPLFRSLVHLKELAGALRDRELRYFLTASETLAQLPGGWQPDVIHAHFAGDQAHVARIISSMMGVPYTVTTHATDIFVPASVKRLKRVLENAFAVFTISNYNREYLEKKGLYSKTAVVSKLGIDTGCLPERTLVKEPAVVCTASGLVEKKGLDVLLKTAELLRGDYSGLRFIVIGSDPSGEILKAYREKAAGLPVFFTGAFSSVETLKAVSEALFFVLPCIQAKNGDLDGIPVSLMEAMGMGIPAISTAVSGIPELIEHGVSGLLAQPGSAESLAEMIKIFLDSPEKAVEMGKQGKARIKALHSPSASMESMLKVIRELKSD